MDDIERTVDDGINTFKCLTKDARFVPGAGATEIELAKQLSSYGEVSGLHTIPGTEDSETEKLNFILDMSGDGAVLHQEVCRVFGVSTPSTSRKLRSKGKMVEKGQLH